MEEKSRINCERLFLQNEIDIILEFVYFGYQSLFKNFKLFYRVLKVSQYCNRKTKMHIECWVSKKCKKITFHMLQLPQSTLNIFLIHIYWIQNKIGPKLFKLFLSLWCQ